MILTLLDTTGTQDYIFGSNRLQENIGASELVYRATTTWAFQVLEELNLKDNVSITHPKQGQWEFEDKTIEKRELDVEVIFAGGGNSLLVFREYDNAKQFVAKLTRRLLKDAPGLTVVAQHESFDWQTDRLDDVRKRLGEKMSAHKQSRLPSAPLLGLGVTQPCASTGLVATRTDEGTTEIDYGPSKPEEKFFELRVGDQKLEKPRPISRETECKIGWRDCANERLKATIGSKYVYPHDVDKLGRIFGEESYVAVIHADGNRMGEHAKNVGEGIDWENKEKRNRDYIKAVRTFSKGINDAGIAALKQVVNLLEKNIAWNQERRQKLVADKVPLNENYLPFRPLVFGGDDVTFLANGQLGLALAAAYLEAFEAAVQENDKLPAIYASAGVATVKMHYPFARAYELSEDLTNRAKRFISSHNKDFSALDWHFATTGLSGSLGTIRRREYSRPNSAEPDLTIRPLRLYEDPNNRDGRYWREGLETIILKFMDPSWNERRNKVKGLRIPLRQGQEAVEKYRTNYNLPSLPNGLNVGSDTYTRTGWLDGRCVYLDAIELLDHYVSLVP